MVRMLLGLSVVLVLGCGQAQPPVTRAVATASASSSASPTSSPEDASPPDAGSVTVAASAKPDPSPPAPVTRSGKVWPFHTWDRGEAIAFNQFQMRPDTPEYVYDDHGWSPHIADRKPVDMARAQKAADLVAQTKGAVSVSKCPFPRHAVVLYDHDVPVASINVCFSCGDILVWPSWEPQPKEPVTDKEMQAWELRAKKQMALYDKAFPKWKVFFRDEVGFPIDTKY